MQLLQVHTINHDTHVALNSCCFSLKIILAKVRSVIYFLRICNNGVVSHGKISCVLIHVCSNTRTNMHELDIYMH